MTILAHISDIHLSPLPPVHFTQLLNKRITGYLNWKMRRKDRLNTKGLERLVHHLRARNPDFVAVTGDLINLSLPSEMAYARKWMNWLAPVDQACVSPGNHDAYLMNSLKEMTQAMGPYMQGKTLDESPFPFVRQLNDVAIISCSSALATPPFCSAGYFDAKQAERLEQILHLTAQDNLFRVIMIHHPPNSDAETSALSRLYGSRRLRKIIAQQGAELILHGHTHASSTAYIDGPDRPVPVIGVAAASAAIGSSHAPARYNLFHITRTASHWSCNMREFGFQRIGDEIVQRIQVRIH